MISKLSEKLTDNLIAKRSIAEDERELYKYGCFILLSYLQYIVLASVFGLFFNCFFESIIFYIAFQLIRRVAGGYHASTETRCEIISTLLILTAIAFIKWVQIHRYQMHLLLFTFISTIFIYVLSPLDTPAKPLSKKEIKYFRKKLRIITMVMIFIVISSYSLNLNFLFVPCCTSLILESLLLISGKIKSA